MDTNKSNSSPKPDPAAVFAAADSLWREYHRQVQSQPSVSLSHCHQGVDDLMREVMRVATAFETWSCNHVEFDEISDVRPYLLQNRFGHECLSVLLPEALAEFDDLVCSRVAARLMLPMR